MKSALAPWSPEAAREAKRAGKFVYLMVAARWCHWCHVMEETTLQELSVQRALKEFVALRADQDSHPELAERFADWGWPANIILNQDLEVVAALRGYQETQPFLQALQNARGLPPMPVPEPAGLEQGSLDRLRAHVQGRLAAFYDATMGGWGEFQKYPHPGPIEAAALSWRMRSDESARQQALATLQGIRQLIDPVWGGAFQYSVRRRWDEPHFEKLLSVQAGVMDAFVRGYHLTGDPAWLADANGIRDYVQARLQLPSGAMAASEDADAQGPDGPIPGATYYALSDAERQKAGAPKRDDAAYADSNGLLASALVTHFEATGDAESLGMAEAVVAAILANHMHGGALTHDGRPGLLHLRDNAAMGRALVAVSQATGNPAYFAHAERLAWFIVAKLESRDGGFYAHTPDPRLEGVFARRRRNLEDNGLAMRFLLEVAWRTEDDELAATCRASAELAARALGVEEMLEPEAQMIGQFLLGLEWLQLPSVQLVISGEGDAATRLMRAALHLDVPGRVVRVAKPGEYPPGAAYVCSGTTCQPVKDAAQLAQVVLNLLGAL